MVTEQIEDAQFQSIQREITQLRDAQLEEAQLMNTHIQIAQLQKDQLPYFKSFVLRRLDGLTLSAENSYFNYLHEKTNCRQTASRLIAHELSEFHGWTRTNGSEMRDGYIRARVSEILRQEGL